MKLGIYVLAFALLVSGVMATSGAIWTTDKDCVTQDENHYKVGGEVWIAGHNFPPGEYVWTITGQPGHASCSPKQVVDDGKLIVDDSGNFCFYAHTVQSEECGEYTVDFDGKNDNYRIDEPEHSQVPEFSTVGSVLALAGIGAFVIRKH